MSRGCWASIENTRVCWKKKWWIWCARFLWIWSKIVVDLSEDTCLLEATVAIIIACSTVYESSFLSRASPSCFSGWLPNSNNNPTQNESSSINHSIMRDADYLTCCAMPNIMELVERVSIYLLLLPSSFQYSRQHKKPLSSCQISWFLLFLFCLGKKSITCDRMADLNQSIRDWLWDVKAAAAEECNCSFFNIYLIWAGIFLSYH